MGFRELQRGVGEMLKDLQTLKHEHAQTRGQLLMLGSIFTRNLRGRLRWLLLGK
jgi:hypothetical protein